MDTIVFSFKPIKCLISQLKHFSKDIDLGAIDPTHENFSKDNTKVIEKMNLESSPEIELDEAVFLRIKSYINKKTMELNRIKRQSNSST